MSENTTSQEANAQPVTQANVAPPSGGNAFDQAQQPVAPAVSAQPVAVANVQPQAQPWAQQASQVVAQAPAQPWAQQPAAPQAPAVTPNNQPWAQQPVASIPAPTLEQMWHAINQGIDSVNIRNYVTIRNKYSNGDLVKSNGQQPQATLVGFGLCMSKGSKQSMALTTRQYNRIVCDLADAIANALGNWHGVDVNATNASAVDVFDKSLVQRPRQQYAQPQYGYAQPPQQSYGYAQPPQQSYGYAQPPQQSYGYAQPPQQSYGYAPQKSYYSY